MAMLKDVNTIDEVNKYILDNKENFAMIEEISKDIFNIYKGINPYSNLELYFDYNIYGNNRGTCSTPIITIFPLIVLDDCYMYLGMNRNHNIGDNDFNNYIYTITVTTMMHEIFHSMQHKHVYQYNMNDIEASNIMYTYNQLFYNRDKYQYIFNNPKYKFLDILFWNDTDIDIHLTVSDADERNDDGKLVNNLRMNSYEQYNGPLDYLYSAITFPFRSDIEPYFSNNILILIYMTDNVEIIINDEHHFLIIENRKLQEQNIYNCINLVEAIKKDSILHHSFNVRYGIDYELVRKDEQDLAKIYIHACSFSTKPFKQLEKE